MAEGFGVRFLVGAGNLNIELLVFFAVFLFEAVNTASCIDDLLFAGIERVAFRADFDTEFFLTTCGLSLKGVTTATAYLYGFVFWMDIFFHFCISN